MRAGRSPCPFVRSAPTHSGSILPHDRPRFLLPDFRFPVDRPCWTSTPRNPDSDLPLVQDREDEAEDVHGRQEEDDRGHRPRPRQRSSTDRHSAIESPALGM
jgi:hypothetical protein